MSIIAAGTTAGTALVATSDTAGTLVIKTNGTTTAATFGTDQKLTLAGALVTTGVSTFAAGSAAAPSLTTTGDTDTGIFFPAADTIGFSEGGAEAMRIDSSGNVGIGTTTLTNKLNVAGAIQSSSPLVAVEANTVALSQESGYARLAAFGPNSSTGGTLYLYSISSNGSVQNGLIVYPSGNLSTPAQSAFIAYMTADSTAATVPFNATNLNRGSHFNTSTFSYTAPITGLYWFNLIIAYATSTAPGLISLFINGGRSRDMVEGNTWSVNLELHAGAHVYLTAGDVIRINNAAAGNIQGGNNEFYSQFSGQFIG